MNVRRRGFTLIEILVTIGILMLLVGIVVFSMSRVSDSSRIRETQVTLGNLKNMVAELEATAGLSGRQPPHMWFDGAIVTSTPAAPIDIWKDANPDDSAVPEPDPVLVPRAIQDDARFDSDAVRNTQLVMILLAQAPKNRTAISSLPSTSIVKLPVNFTETAQFDETTETGVMLDSWGNPILFVSAGGLSGLATDTTDPLTDGSMWIGGEPRRVNASTTAKQVVPNPPAGSTTEVGPIRSSDGRPFWASAGPDGDFRRADDNLYSFEN